MPTVMNGVSLNALTTVDTWSALSLFANGEQGTWYDPSDMSTMFQDAAGTTPVTAVEQPVGLLLDKSKGLVVSSTDALGGNGNFSNASYWQDVNGVSTISGGQLSFNGSATLGGVWSGPLNNPLTIGRFYQVTFDVVSISQGGIRVWLGTGTPTYTATTTGTHTFRAACIGDIEVRIYNNGAATSAVVDNLVIREVLGNHARQSTDASRPVLSAKVNLLTYSEAIASSFITGGSTTLTNNQAVTPSGAPATRLVPTTGTGSHYAYYASTFGAGTFTFSLEVKAAGYPRIGLRVYDGGTYRIYATIDLTTGLPVGTPTGTVTTTNLGDGWWKISIQSEATTSNMGATAGWVIESLPSGVTVQSSFTGDGTSGMFVSKVDIRVTNVGTNLPAYQRVGAATDYNTSGFPLYLKFDGTDDSLATGSIDFSATDKMSVFAGVRKMSDDTPRCVVELSATVNTNNGSFGIFAPSIISGVYTGKYVGSLRGTAQSISELTTYTAPITNTLSAQYDISGASIAAESIYRVNGSAPTETTNGTQAGTGNFGNYPLYIGSRAGLAVPFNGHLYSLIVRGALSNSTQIENAENYINSKTKAY